jgi:hypothetical protein
MYTVLVIFYTTLLNLGILHPYNHNEGTQCVICALLVCYASYSDDSLPTFLDNLTVPYSEVWTDRLTPKFDKKLTLYAT